MDKEWIIVKKNLFKSTASTSEGVFKVEPISPNLFYGKSVGSIRLRTEEKDHVNKSLKNHNNSIKTYFEPAARCPVFPNGKTPKKKRTCHSGRAIDDLPDQFFDEFASTICEKETKFQ